MFDRIRNLLRINKAYGQWRDLLDRPERRRDPTRWAAFFTTLWSITEVQEVAGMLQGYKTYIIAALMGLCTAANALNYIDDETFKVLMAFLGSLGVGTLAAKVNRSTKVGVILLASLLLLSSGVQAQTLQASAVRLARASASTLQATPPAPASGLPEPTDTWLRGLEIGFITANAADGAAACVAVRQTDTAGNPINQPTNIIMGSSCQTIMIEKAGVVVGGILAIEKLWPNHKWEAILTGAGATLVTLASAMKSVYDITKPGEYPVPQGRRLALRFTIAR